MPFAIDNIQAALARHQPAVIPREPGLAEAAVAVVLAGPSRHMAVCAIRRAHHPLDPWSGHMALPGGRSSPGDPNPRAVAERETREEVGLAVGEKHWLGPLSELPVRLGGSGTGLVLSPFVYYLGEKLPGFVVSEEVAEAFWIPLAHLWDPRNASHMEWERNGSLLSYPAIRFGDHAIWGITFRVLTLFSDVLDQPLPHLEEIPGLGR